MRFGILLYESVEPIDLATFGVLSMARPHMAKETARIMDYHRAWEANAALYPAVT